MDEDRKEKKYPNINTIAPDSVFPPDQCYFNGKKLSVNFCYPVFSALLRYYGVALRWNEFTHEVKMTVADEPIEGNLDVFLSETIFPLLTVNRLHPKEKLVVSFVQKSARENPFHDVKAYLENGTWDGQRDYIEELCLTLCTTPKFNRDLLAPYIKRALINAVAMVYRSEEDDDDYRSRSVLTLIGPAGCGKTNWTRLLCPPTLRKYYHDGFFLDPANKDTILSLQGKWIVELGEVGATTRKDTERLKAFITAPSDLVRKPYAIDVTKYKRRSLFVATSNTSALFSDSALADRFWCVPVLSCAPTIAENVIRGVWVQAKALYDQGEQWWLTEDEELRHRGALKTQMIENPVISQLDSVINWTAEKAQWSWSGYNQYLTLAGLSEPQKNCSKIICTYFESHSAEKRHTRSGNQWFLPPLNTASQEQTGITSTVGFAPAEVTQPQIQRWGYSVCA